MQPKQDTVLLFIRFRIRVAPSENEKSTPIGVLRSLRRVDGKDVILQMHLRKERDYQYAL